MSELEYLRSKLLEQLDLLIFTAEGYDAGRKVQALHIATVLRTFFSDSRGGKGVIFRILSLKPRQIFLNSSCPHFDRPPRLFIGLVDYLVRNHQGEVVPHLDGSKIPEGQYVQFAQILLCDGPTPEYQLNRINQIRPRKWLEEAIFILSPSASNHS